MVICITQMTQEGWKAPHLNSSAREEGRGQKEQITVSAKASAKNLRNAGLSPVLQGMDRGEVLAYINRVFDAQAAGAVLWGDKLLVKKFLNSCSRSGSIETRNGYMREIRYLMRWQNKNHPKLHLRELDPAICQDFVDELLELVEAKEIKPRTFNRRVAAISALFRWASEPTRSAVTGVPRNPMPRRAQLVTPKCARALPETELDAVLGVIANAAKKSKTAKRDYVIVRGAYLVGCRVSELARIKWKDIEEVPEGGQIHLLGKGSKARTVRVSAETLELFESLGRKDPEAFVFTASRTYKGTQGTGRALTRQAIGDRMKKWGKLAEVHLYPHKLRHTHATQAIRRGVDVFTLQTTLGHSSSETTSAYVAANPSHSSSLKLG